MPIIKIVPMPGPSGTGGNGISSVEPLELNDQDGNLLLSIEKTGTGTTRIESVQDDLSLRSARDITLYPGSDGPGNVYIGWGDAEMTPNSNNRVATTGYVDDAVENATGLSGITAKTWGYPTSNGVAIIPPIGESVAVKSSQSASLRWHIREGGLSLSSWSLVANSIYEQTGENGVGPYQVTFMIDEVDYAMPTGYRYNVQANSPWDGAYLCTASSTTSITLEYPGPNLPGGNEEFTGGNIFPPSIYTQVEANEDGVWIKNANWTEDPTYVNYWQFGNDGVTYLPNNGSLVNESNSSGDGNGYSTISIIPDQSRVATDQYIVVDPTQPNHIHIRAGGTQDASNAELILGAEEAHVRVVDYNKTVNILANDVNISSLASPSALNINTYLGAIVNSNRTSGYADEDKVVATLGDLPSGATGSFTSADGKTITVTNGIITGIE